ncbi:hypothetical protein KDD17_17485 [Sulfitobacter albidus]|uniref:Uncharacterized protein n=1 Tax=Sulfitobacter albidus TaxID=2829501 RepID=A0A975JGK7_9RHOB|nr:hypothetical protein [Sulfitobacter albidus]QUJ78134.1 hypothetical protein KDD17_17485 [Sulfitobacter albidus]
MNAINCDDSEARCAEGNLFRFNGEDANFTVEGLVNGQSTGPLPHGERMILPNTLAGTTNTLAVRLRGTTHNICNLNDFNITSPQDVGVLISEVGPNTRGGGGGGTEEDLLVCEIPASLESMITQEGDIDIDTAPNDVLLRVASAILIVLEVVDEATLTQSLFDATDGYVDLRMTGTDGAPAVAEAVQALAGRNGRAALRAIVQGGQGALRVMRNGIGSLVIVARLNSGISRQLAVGVAAGLARSRLSTVVAGTRGQIGAPGTAPAMSRVPVVGFVIVGTINFLQWYENPSSRGDWNRLFSMLVVDGTALVISTVAANMVIGGLITMLGGAAMLTVGTGLLVVGAGLVAGLVVGAIVTAVARHFGLEDQFYKLMGKVSSGLGAVAQGAVEITGRFADTLGQIADDLRETGGEIRREWNSGWGQVRRNLMSGRGSGLF